MTRLRMKLKNQSKKALKGKIRQNFAEGGGATSSKPQSSLEKKSTETKFQNQKKSHRNLLLKLKVPKKKVNSDPKAPKMATTLASDQNGCLNN